MEDKRQGKSPDLGEPEFCFLSTYPPKECGIATFTQDLSTAIDKEGNPIAETKVLAVEENGDDHRYNGKVIETLDSEVIGDYIEKAKVINKNDRIKLVNIQHEFGLYSGKYGSYIIPFLETLEKPVVITFHSVLPDPDKVRSRIVQGIAKRVEAIVVLAKKAMDILRNDYGIDEEKLHLIRHGIPNIKFQPDNKDKKKKLGLKGKKVLTTFGLLDKGKGIEYVIRALPDLVKEHPNLLYLVVGETHPEIKKKEGEKYREKLKKEVKEKGLENNVKFISKYVELEELLDYLLATDLYICTNLDHNQVVSGTLSYAMGCGKAIISTPIPYSKEILNNRGLLADFENPDSFKEAIDKLLSNPRMKREMEKKAYEFSRSMIWPNIASKYISLFNNIVREKNRPINFPPIKLDHLDRMTDKTGMIQFASHSQPDKGSGYTIDDNSRALIVATLHNRLFNSDQSLKLAKKYLEFIEKAQEEDGNFKNNFKNGNELLDRYSDDSFGRALWSLGFTVDKGRGEIAKESRELFENSIGYINNLESLRGKAFSVMGLSHYYSALTKQEDKKRIEEKIKKLADSLVKAYEEKSDKDWKWFEDRITYSNSKLPESLFFAYQVLDNKKYLEVAEDILSFLTKIHFIDDELAPIGQNGWFNRHGERAFFDQQPVDASSMVQTYLIAYEITDNKEYYNNAIKAFNWFLGKNHLNQPMYDETTGGCYDGLSSDFVNPDQGAESTICYLIARLFFEEIGSEE